MSATKPEQVATAKPGFEAGAAFVDGEVVPIGEAKISIVDTGFSRSDVTYDVVGVWDGAFFRLDDHLERFERSCRELRMTLPHTRDEMAEILTDLVRTAGLRESYVETICTRGIAGAVRDPRTFENRFYAFAIPFGWILPPEDQGMHAVITRTVQRIPPRSVDPTVKNYHWADLTKGLYEAFDRDARYPILLSGKGDVAEGAGYNVFALVDGRLLTPVDGALEGITRRTVLELAAEEGIPAGAVERPRRCSAAGASCSPRPPRAATGRTPGATASRWAPGSPAR